jgi:hypothetical protein
LLEKFNFSAAPILIDQPAVIEKILIHLGLLPAQA